MTPDFLLRIAMYVLFAGILGVTAGNLMERNGVQPALATAVRYIGLACLAIAVLLSAWSKWKERGPRD